MVRLILHGPKHKPAIKTPPIPPEPRYRTRSVSRALSSLKAEISPSTAPPRRRKSVVFAEHLNKYQKHADAVSSEIPKDDSEEDDTESDDKEIPDSDEEDVTDSDEEDDIEYDEDDAINANVETGCGSDASPRLNALTSVESPRSQADSSLLRHHWGTLAVMYEVQRQLARFPGGKAPGMDLPQHKRVNELSGRGAMGQLTARQISMLRSDTVRMR
jgi:hypothetical protein